MINTGVMILVSRHQVCNFSTFLVLKKINQQSSCVPQMKSGGGSVRQLADGTGKFVLRREFWVPFIKFVAWGLFRDVLRCRHMICTCDSFVKY